jgi:hypothetical protein
MKKLLSVIFILVLAVCAFGQKVIELPMLSKPNWFFYPIHVVEDKMVIADGLQVLFFSLDDFKLIKSFGKKGEGPHEFLGYDDGTCVLTTVNEDSIVVDSVGKIEFYSKSGEFKKSLKTQNGNYFRSLGDNDYLLGYTVEVEDNVLYGLIYLYDMEFNKVKLLSKFKEPFLQKKVNPYDYRRPLPIVYEGKLFLDRRDGTFDVFDKKGNTLYAITYDYEKIPVTDAHIKHTIELMKADPRISDKFEQFKSRLDFPKYFPIMKHYSISDGKIYVLTYKEKDNKCEFVVLDTKGKFIKKILFPLAQISFVEPYPYTIHKGKVYQLVENQKTEMWELHITDIQ